MNWCWHFVSFNSRIQLIWKSLESWGWHLSSYFVCPNFFYFSFLCSLPSFILYFLVWLRFPSYFKAHLVLVTLLSLFEIIFIYVCLHVSTCIFMQVPKENRRGHFTSWSWRLKWLWTTWWGSGTKLRSSERLASVVNCWATSLASVILIYLFR